jgi:large subunit ribosomal protein L18
MFKKESKNEVRQKRHLRIRQTIIGTDVRPRLCVYRSNKALYCQVIDDTKQVTIVSARTQELGFKSSNIESATALGGLIAKKAVEAGVSVVVFDRGGYLYHGKIKALADAARAAGLQF